jgi:hypothetical protein
MTDSLAEDFRMKLKDFHSKGTNIHTFEHSISAEVNEAPGKLKLGVTESKYDSFTQSCFNQQPLITFYTTFNLMLLVALSYLSWHKNWQVYLVNRLFTIETIKIRISLTVVHFYCDIKWHVKFGPNFNSLVKQGKAKASHS